MQSARRHRLAKSGSLDEVDQRIRIPQGRVNLFAGSVQVFTKCVSDGSDVPLAPLRKLIRRGSPVWPHGCARAPATYASRCLELCVLNA